ncbi:MAG: hypothetical protein WA738_08540 [Candidatus Angelobacter sp.]
MHTVSSSTTPIQLTWIKSNHGYELSANGPIVGSLQRVGFWRSATQAEFKGRSWLFQRSGCNRTEILQQPGARPVANFNASWLGGGTLVFADGRRFQLIAKGFWRPVWSWVDDLGRKLIQVTPHEKTVRVIEGATADERNSNQEKMPVLIMFSWHQILQANDDAAAIVAMSAAAG